MKRQYERRVAFRYTKTFLLLGIKTKKLFFRVLGILLVIYLLMTAGIYFFQERIIFQRQKLDKDYGFTFKEEFQEHFIPTGDGETLNVLLFPTSLPSKGLILYFHGNANNLQRWGSYAVDFTALGYDVLIMDYRGYGKSTGLPSEQNFYNDAKTLLAWARINVPHNKIIFYGRSLGSAVASYLATVENPDLLILETPFDELTGTIYTPFKPVLSIFPLRYKFSNADHLKEVRCKKIILHGTRDRIVPLSSALRLKPLLKEGDSFIIIEDGSHRNLRGFDQFHQVLKENLP